MKLKIKTTKPGEVLVQLYSGQKKVSSLLASQTTGSQVLLPLINKILKENQMKLVDLSSIEVDLGPGSFTGTRVGVTVANALGYALKIPVNGKKGKIALPKYTKSKFD